MFVGMLQGLCCYGTSSDRHENLTIEQNTKRTLDRAHYRYVTSAVLQTEKVSTALEKALGLLPNGVLCDPDALTEMVPYASLIEKGKHYVAAIDIRNCLPEYDFSPVFDRHKATLKSFSAVYPSVVDRHGMEFKEAMVRLGRNLKVLRLLVSCRIVANTRSQLPVCFLQGHEQLGNLRSLSLECGKFDVGAMRVSFPEQLERLSFVETSHWRSDDDSSGPTPVNLQHMTHLRAVRISAHRPLILPIDTSNLVAVYISHVTSLECAGPIPTLKVLKWENSPFRLIESIIAEAEVLLELSIAYDAPADLTNCVLDARRLDCLSLFNVDIGCIRSSAGNHLKALCLSDVSFSATPTPDTLIHATSVYVAYSDRCRPQEVLAFLHLDAVKALVFGREHQEVPELTALDEEAMAIFTKLNKTDLEFFATFAPIQELPGLPSLKFLGLSSEKQLTLVEGHGLHVGLSIITFDSLVDSLAVFRRSSRQK